MCVSAWRRLLGVETQGLSVRSAHGGVGEARVGGVHAAVVELEIGISSVDGDSGCVGVVGGAVLVAEHLLELVFLAGQCVNLRDRRDADVPAAAVVCAGVKRT